MALDEDKNLLPSTTFNMKFARYLEQTQVPEWKRAYIDFKGLKGRISIIRKAKYATKASLPSQLSNIPETSETARSDSSTKDAPKKADSILGRSRMVPISANRLNTSNGERESAYLPHLLLNERLKRKSSSTAEGSVEQGYPSRTSRSSIMSRGPDVNMTVESFCAALEPIELNFFTCLDRELQKVDQFYNAREIAAITRLSELKDQLREFLYQRTLWGEAQSRHNDYWKLPKVLGGAPRAIDEPAHWDSRPDLIYPKIDGESFLDMTIQERLARDPPEYQHARRRLKKALREFYRSLELLNDYRVLNFTGFRKALKKYEKVTKLVYPDFPPEWDVRTAIHIREYFELPSFLLATLCFSFWLAFSQIGNANVAPTSWPLVWITFSVIIMINPLPIFSRDSRYWVIRRISRLLIPGASPVGFTDFWLGDQFCSLAFSVQHIYTIGCAYIHHWDNVFYRCDSTMHVIPLLLIIAPYVSRFLQCLRRYYDSRLPSHLVNARICLFMAFRMASHFHVMQAGKYFMSVVCYVTYYIWRSRGAPSDDTFVVWVMVATISSIYSVSWDLLVDWSFLQRHSAYRFLRSELIYSNNPFMYYFAIVTNIILRFTWVTYIPVGGLDPRVRTAIMAALEMLRRFQWNFYRLENEHIGNTDQFRATREVPLPYSFMRGDDDDYDIEDRTDDQMNRYAGVHRRGGKLSRMTSTLVWRRP
ncbi:EXS family-domain-containing protein [Hysterangium stoloniferum]|nr:EXS family-domain-containing protein [Hysterangium stoloniferum]